MVDPKPPQSLTSTTCDVSQAGRVSVEVMSFYLMSLYQFCFFTLLVAYKTVNINFVFESEVYGNFCSRRVSENPHHIVHDHL
jgi:hypothetical protein